MAAMRNTWLPVYLLCAACGGMGGGNEVPGDLMVIAATPAAGTIAGVPFTLGMRSMNVSGGDLNIDLLTDVGSDCTKDETNGSYPFVILFTPATAGTYPLGTDQFVTFVDAPSDNLIVSRGVVQIDSVTQTAVSAGLHVFDPTFGEINGRFDGPVCFTN